MSLTGMILDVSRSMRGKIKGEPDERVGPWAQSIFQVIDYFIHDDAKVFAIGVGALVAGRHAKEIFDVIGTVEQIKAIVEEPATKETINDIFDILQNNGARNIRIWARDITLIQKTVSDYKAKTILLNLKDDKDFLRTFVQDILPHSVRDREQERKDEGVSGTNQGGIKRNALTASLMSRIRPANEQDIKDVVEKARTYLTSKGKWKLINNFGQLTGTSKQKTRHSLASGKDVHLILQDVDIYKSIFSVHDASRIIHGYIGETKELSSARQRELLTSIEPFIYGLTPLYQSLKVAVTLFKREICENKILFVLSDGEPTDGKNDDTVQIEQITSQFRDAGVKVVTCFITRSTDIEPKRLYDKMENDWEPGAKFLFSLSSKVSTQLLPRAILAKREWTLDITNNETKLFIQINHPDNLREFCEIIKDVLFSQDALPELLASVDLDMYINKTTTTFTPKNQQKDTCYAHAVAAVLHLAMQRIYGRDEGCPDFHTLKDEIIRAYGERGANTCKVLKNICPQYRLYSEEVDIIGAKKAIVEKRFVVARFRLTDDEWEIFSSFYKHNPAGVLTQEVLDVRKRPTSEESSTSGHAVVLTSYNSKCLTFMNSQGAEWADNGFFKIQNDQVLQLEFFDVNWTLNDLSETEKKNYQQRGYELTAKLTKSLEGLQKGAEYTCPKCKKESPVTKFTGTISKVCCPRCHKEFSTWDNASNILALSIYLVSKSKSYNK
ncbi:uncharacterized protein LOC114517178 [Dendronephthya gigantea]|uniref:uncharacterized protein LOC114517178 n=1 Tax=Dendronephthya gigantea TaxID=151771 RepID=UPI00106DB2C7|nr:uncharacterized protein LOC114517178 [Dendronephthya gigantea]